MARGAYVFIDDGRLSMFEGYTHGREEWNEETKVVSIGRVIPLTAANPSLQTDGRVGRSAPSRVRR